jgi:hypothetical protein
MIWTTVSDTTAPTVDSPDDITISFGTVGAYVMWTPFDYSPAWYTVLLDDAELESMPWDGSPIHVLLDGLVVGTHNSTVTVDDDWEHRVSGSVIVTVTNLIVGITIIEPTEGAVIRGGQVYLSQSGPCQPKRHQTGTLRERLKRYSCREAVMCEVQFHKSLAVRQWRQVDVSQLGALQH